MYWTSQKILHALLAFLFFCQMGAMLAVHTMNLDRSLIGQIFFYHKSTGLALLFLGGIFLFLRLFNSPGLKGGLKLWEKVLAGGIHKILLVLILLMPLSGVLMSLYSGRALPFFDIFTLASPFEKNKMLAGLFNKIHVYGAWILYVAVFFHSAGALKHAWEKQKEHLGMILPKSCL